jgi:hypothetical protein
MLGFLLSRYGLYVLAIVASLIGWQAFKIHYMHKGETKVIERSEKEAKKINEKVTKRTSRISTDAAAKRLFSDYHR